MECYLGLIMSRFIRSYTEADEMNFAVLCRGSGAAVQDHTRDMANDHRVNGEPERENVEIAPHPQVHDQANHIAALIGPSPPSRSPNENPINFSPRRPSDHLLRRENRSQYLNVCVPLFKAAQNGDWETAKRFIGREDPMHLLRSSITEGYETLLHVAVGARQRAFVEELLKVMERDDLALQDRNGNTAFSFAAATGSVPIVKLLLEKNPSLPKIRGGANTTTLYTAVLCGRHEVAWIIYNQIHDLLEKNDRVGIFFGCLDTGLFDLALALLEKDPELAVDRCQYEETALHVLARKPSVFENESSTIWKRLIHSCMGSKNNIATSSSSMQMQALKLVRRIWKKVLMKEESEVKQVIRHPFRLLFEAAKLGNYKFLAELTRFYPDLIWEVDEINRTIFHFAVLYRQANIFNQIYKIGLIKDVIVTHEVGGHEYMMHLAAQLPPNLNRLEIVSGAALKMQRELLWFKEVEKIMPPSLREMKDFGGRTAREVFTEEHKDLKKKGEEWMKNTAHSCIIVATLVTTVVFSAAFSVPGGNDSTMGTPIQLKTGLLFHVFAVSDALALSSSIISTVMFLSILTSRYAEIDFLESLPFKLMVGLSTLFISMMAMVIAFSTCFLLAYHQYRIKWVPLLISGLALAPAIVFIMSQFHLLYDVLHSTYRSRFLFQPNRSMLS